MNVLLIEGGVDIIRLGHGTTNPLLAMRIQYAPWYLHDIIMGTQDVYICM